MSTWQSETINVNGLDLQVQADAEGVNLGKTVDGIYASDLKLTDEQARELAYNLTIAARKHRAAKLLAARGGES